MKILFFGDDVWAARALDRLVADGHTICGVVVRVRPRNRSLADSAERFGIAVLQPSDVNAQSFVAHVQHLAPELIVSVSYDQIFGPQVLASALKGGLNVHNGLLPNYRGGGGLYGAIINGESSFGQTAHVITSAVDGGPIVVQRELPIRPEDTMGDLIERATMAIPDTVAAAVTMLASGVAELRPQSAEGSYFPKKPDGDEIIDWSEPSRLLLDKIRARRPRPGNVTYVGRQRIVVWKASETRYPRYIGPVGQVLACRPDGVVVKTGDGAIAVHEVQIDDGPIIVPRFRVSTSFLANWRHAYLELQSEVDRMSERLRELELVVSGAGLRQE